MPSASKLDSKGCGDVGSGGAGGGFNGRTTLRPVFPERGCRGWKCHPGNLFSKYLIVDGLVRLEEKLDRLMIANPGWILAISCNFHQMQLELLMRPNLDLHWLVLTRRMLTHCYCLSFLLEAQAGRWIKAERVKSSGDQRLQRTASPSSKPPRSRSCCSS